MKHVTSVVEGRDDEGYTVFDATCSCGWTWDYSPSRAYVVASCAAMVHRLRARGEPVPSKYLR